MGTVSSISKFQQEKVVLVLLMIVGILGFHTECVLPERDIARKECCASSYARTDKVRARAGARSAKVGFCDKTMGYIPDISTYIIYS